MSCTHKQYPRSLFQLVRWVSYDSAQINDQGSLYGRFCPRACYWLYPFVVKGVPNFPIVSDDGSMGNKGQIRYPSDVTDEEWPL